LKKAIVFILTVSVVVLAFSLVWMHRYAYFETSGPGVLKVVRINRFTGRYQYSQMRGDGVWSDNIGEHPKENDSTPVDLSGGLINKQTGKADCKMLPDGTYSCGDVKPAH
jgi:hypothetical protein